MCGLCGLVRKHGCRCVYPPAGGPNLCTPAVLIDESRRCRMRGSLSALAKKLMSDCCRCSVAVRRFSKSRILSSAVYTHTHTCTRTHTHTHTHTCTHHTYIPQVKMSIKDLRGACTHETVLKKVGTSTVLYGRAFVSAHRLCLSHAYELHHQQILIALQTVKLLLKAAVCPNLRTQLTRVTQHTLSDSCEAQ